MTRSLSVLDDLCVASPCSASWEAMSGDDRVRFCGCCKLHVYNLSEMSRPDAEQLIRQTDGRLCVRFYQRADGTVLTQNCPLGLQSIRRRMASHLRKVAAAFGIALGGLASGGCMGAVPVVMGVRCAQTPTSQPANHDASNRAEKQNGLE